MTDGEDLPPIPRTIWTRDVAPQFCRWGDGWAVVGPAEVLPEGSEVAVWRHTVGRYTTVAIGPHVAARTVRHRRDSVTYKLQGESTRFVVAEIRERVDAPS